MKMIKAKLKTTKTPARVTATKAPAPIRAPKRSTRTTAVTAPAPKTAAPRGEITSDLIAARAYIIWEQQGRPPGNDVANWLLAENQLKREIQSFPA